MRRTTIFLILSEVFKINKAIIIGNLTKDPEARATTSGISVCSFTVAVQRRFKDANGERGADFIPVVVWRTQADNCAKYLSKGSKVAVSGSIQTRNYEAQDGTKRYVTEIIADEVEFLNTKAKDVTQGEYDAPEGFEVMDDDSDLPF
jgi:single-strand DNA-binding protein